MLALHDDEAGHEKAMDVWTRENFNKKNNNIILKASISSLSLFLYIKTQTTRASKGLS